MTQKLKGIMSFLLVLIAILNLPITTKTPYDEGMASEIVKASYLPVMRVVEALEVTSDPDLLKVPSYIKSEEDFVSVLAFNMDDHLAEDIYEDWILEEGGSLYAKSSYYIPTIYDDSREITKAYIASKQSILDKIMKRKEIDSRELIIKERQKEYNTSYHKRTYHYELDEDNNLMLEHVNGTTSIGFAKTEDNPWQELWLSN